MKRGLRKTPPSASEMDMVAAAMTFLNQQKKGKRTFPTDAQLVDYLKKTFQVTTARAVDILRYVHRSKAEVVAAIAPTLAQTTILDLREQVEEARQAGDLGTAMRGRIALGRFAGLDNPLANPEGQARQLSDAALEAAMQAQLAHALEKLPDDQLADLIKRREAKRIQLAKSAQSTLPPAGGSAGKGGGAEAGPSMIDAESRET